MTTQAEEIKGLNVHLASMRRALHEREEELASLQETITCMGLSGMTPAQMTAKLCDLVDGAVNGRAAAEKLAAYESQMLYRIEAYDSDSHYAAPEAIVTLHGEMICGCDSMDRAAKVASDLNRLPEKGNLD